MTAYLLYAEAPDGAAVASAFVDLTPAYAHRLMSYFALADVVARVHPEFNKLVFYDPDHGCVWRSHSYARLDGSKLVRARPTTVTDVVSELDAGCAYGDDATVRVTRKKVWWTCLDDELNVLVYTQPISRRRIARLAAGTP